MEKDIIQNFIQPGKKAHLVGIGGVSMAPLAEVLHGEGLIISGSDMRESPAVEHLRSLGIEITIGHFSETVEGKDLVIRTAAVRDENPEISGARERSIPVFERAQAWGSIMRRYKNALCIAGTHGKTTTTSMSTHIAMAADNDPTVMIGGTLPLLGTGHRVGKGETIILESCEYCNSFLSFFPTVAVILNIEADHLDFFKDLADIQSSFRTFAQLVPENGYILANGEDANTMEALKGMDSVITFGVENGDFHCENLVWKNGYPDFDLVRDGQVIAHIALRVPGMHNVKNAIAAASAASLLGIPAQAIHDGLLDFIGAGRRFEFKGTVNGADVYDDYAHHPGELQALLETTRTLQYNRVICVFQPHTYSRTKSLLEEFSEVLKLPDITILSDIYAAREVNTYGVSSQDIADRIPGAVVLHSFDEIKEHLRQLAHPGDLILTVGAGDIFTVGEALTR